MAALLRDGRADPGASALSVRRPSSGSIKVMVIDDSLTARTVFSRLIEREADMAVVAQAATAEQALLLLRTTQVDVVLLDLEMPGMGGLEALPQILETGRGLQVLVVSSLTGQGAEATLSALQMGAADTMLKPRPGGFDDDCRGNLLGKIRALGRRSPAAALPRAQPVRPARRSAPKQPKVLAIGASTGGIHALTLFLRRLPPSFELPILITQHLPESFMPAFARQMEAAAGREAQLAADGTVVVDRRIIIAPGYAHMVARRSGGAVATALNHDTVASGCRPSVDPMFETLAEAYDGHVAAVLLSGMGRDGTLGAERVAASGGGIYAQDEASCAVWGMPRAVSESGIACAVAHPEELADRIVGAAAGVRPWH